MSGLCGTVKSFGINHVLHNKKHKKWSIVKSGILGGHVTINYRKKEKIKRVRFVYSQLW
jgi:hypothetical protein